MLATQNSLCWIYYEVIKYFLIVQLIRSILRGCARWSKKWIAQDLDSDRLWIKKTERQIVTNGRGMRKKNHLLQNLSDEQLQCQLHVSCDLLNNTKRFDICITNGNETRWFQYDPGKMPEYELKKIFLLAKINK